MFATQDDELGAEVRDCLPERDGGAPEPDCHVVDQLARHYACQDRRDVCARLVDEGVPQLVDPFLHPYGGPHVTRCVNQVASRSGPLRHADREGCRDRKSTRLNSSHGYISYAVFCLKKKKKIHVSCTLAPTAALRDVIQNVLRPPVCP